jgi:hypothetical protein
VAVFVSVISFITTQWLLRGEHFFGSAIDPDCGYRVEYYRPDNLQYIFHFTMRDPAFVRLVRNTDSTIVATSHVVDFFGGNGAVVWAIGVSGRVSVGRDILFSSVPQTKPACSTSNHNN